MKPAAQTGGGEQNAAARRFVRRAGVILGPFSPAELETMLRTGQLDGTVAVSPDKRVWEPLTPSGSTDAPEPPAPPRSPKSPQTPESPPPQRPRSPMRIITRDDVELKKKQFTIWLLPETIALLWDSATAMERLASGGRQAMLRSAAAGFVLALGLVIASLLLFAARYPAPPGLTARLVIGSVPALWLLLFCELSLFPRRPGVSAAQTLLAATMGTLNTAAGEELSLALLFFANSRLYSPPAAGLAAAALAVLGVWSFFLSNFTGGLRHYLRTAAGQTETRLVWSAGLCQWTVTALCGVIFLMIFKRL